MNNSRNKRMIALGAAAFLLTAGAAADRAMAYFTTYVEASGGQELHLGFTTTIPSEEVSDWTKNITVSNTGEQSCYARVKVLAGSSYALNFTDHSGGNWSAGADGYYYWHEILPPGGSTGSILAKIENLGEQDEFNVIVIQECTPVPYQEDGTPVSWDQVDWSRKADIVKREDTQTVTGGEDKS